MDKKLAKLFERVLYYISYLMAKRIYFIETELKVAEDTLSNFKLYSKMIFYINHLEDSTSRMMIISENIDDLRYYLSRYKED